MTTKGYIVVKFDLTMVKNELIIDHRSKPKERSHISASNSRKTYKTE